MPNNLDELIKKKINGIKATMREAPGSVGNIAVNHFKQSFQVGGFIGDNGIERWKLRKKPNSKQNAGRALLVKTGKLKNSIRVISANQKQIIVGSGRPYAAIQNNGGTIHQAARSELFIRNRYTRKTGKTAHLAEMFGGMGAFKKGTKAGKGQTYKARVINIPARKFMGNSSALNRKIDNWYLARLKQNGVF